jgi:hypothetical protein
VQNFEIDTSGFTEIEKEVLKEHRWWELEGLESTKDLMTPRSLAILLPELLHAVPPLSPKDVGV